MVLLIYLNFFQGLVEVHVTEVFFIQKKKKCKNKYYLILPSQQTGFAKTMHKSLVLYANNHIPYIYGFSRKMA